MKRIIVIFLVTALMMSFKALAVDNAASETSSGGEFQKVGAAGGQFLKIGVGARANAMGGAYTSESGDLNSIYWNPAGLAAVKKASADFSYTQWFGNFNHNYFAAALPLGQFTLAANFISFASDDIEITTLTQPDGTGAKYSVNDMAFGMTFSGYLTEEFSFGITAKYVQQAFASVSSNGFAFDVGTLYDVGLYGLKLGIALHNLGGDQSYTGEDLATTKKFNEAIFGAPTDATLDSYPYSLPLIFRAGISSDVYTDDISNVLVAADFITMSDVPEQFAIGAEYTWKNFLSFRGGYHFGHDQEGLSGGVGINYIGGDFNGTVDYSITPTTDLGIINRISVGIRLGS